MALQDLTPQLRTRLNRMERLVGLFVGAALLILIGGFVYYAYHTAQRKGWLLKKVPYFTFVRTATGLQVGDPVKLMGFDVGEITRIEAQPPEDTSYNVYVQFLVKEPYYGYLWSVGSVARITSADLLGKRVIEVTKGSSGMPTYLFWRYEVVPLADLAAMSEAQRGNYVLAGQVRSGQSNILAAPLEAPTAEDLARFKAAGLDQVAVLNRKFNSKGASVIWDRKLESYQPYKKGEVAPYWLEGDEAPALSDRLQQIAGQVDTALPALFSLTNQVRDALVELGRLSSNASHTVVRSEPLLTNLTLITAQLTDLNGSLGRWLIPTNLDLRLAGTLDAASLTLTNTDARLGQITLELTRTLELVRALGSNLNTQVEYNSNFLSQVSGLVTNTDNLITGLKRHWLLRSAYKEKKTNAPPPSVVSPKGSQTKMR